MNTSRRGFLSSLAVAPLAAGLAVKAGLSEPLYGTSPAMAALPAFKNLNKVSYLRTSLPAASWRQINNIVLDGDLPYVRFRGIPIRVVDNLSPE